MLRFIRNSYYKMRYPYREAIRRIMLADARRNPYCTGEHLRHTKRQLERKAEKRAKYEKQRQAHMKREAISHERAQAQLSASYQARMADITHEWMARIAIRASGYRGPLKRR